jgi:hypothetical protein
VFGTFPLSEVQPPTPRPFLGKLGQAAMQSMPQAALMWLRLRLAAERGTDMRVLLRLRRTGFCSPTAARGKLCGLCLPIVLGLALGSQAHGAASQPASTQPSAPAPTSPPAVTSTPTAGKAASPPPAGPSLSPGLQSLQRGLATHTLNLHPFAPAWATLNQAITPLQLTPAPVKVVPIAPQPAAGSSYRAGLLQAANPQLLTSAGTVQLQPALTGIPPLTVQGIKNIGKLVAPSITPVPTETVCPVTQAAAETGDGQLYQFSDVISWPLVLWQMGTLSGPATESFVVNSPNITFCIPGYVMYSDVAPTFSSTEPPTPVTLATSQYADPVAVELQTLALDSQGQPIADPYDPTGFSWTSFSGLPVTLTNPSVAVNTGPQLCYSAEPADCASATLDLNQMGDVWLFNYAWVDNSVNNFNNNNFSYLNQAGQTVTAPIVFLENEGDGTPQDGQSQSSANTLQITANLTSIATPLRFVVADCSGGGCTDAEIANTLNVHNDATPTAIWTTMPFYVLTEPTAFVQQDVQPLFVLYQPPGSQSTASYQTGQTDVSSITNTVTSGSSTSTTQATSGSVGFSVGVTISPSTFSGGLGSGGGSAKLSAGFNFSSTNNWSNSTESTNGHTTSTANSTQLSVQFTQNT